MSSLLKSVLGCLIAFVLVLAPALTPGMLPTNAAHAANPTCSPTDSSYLSGTTSYKVLKFTSTGTCDWTVPTGVNKVDVLVVGAGGGGGGTGSRNGWASGGGAGGSVVSVTAIAVTDGNTIPVVVGAGGTGGSNSSNTGVPTVGGDSSFDSTTLALGGGRGGHSMQSSYASTDGSAPSGGSRNGGGGGAQTNAFAGATGPYSGGSGFGSLTATQSAGGGAGAGGNGVSGWAYYSGAGGVGVQSSITGSAVYYGGGGGGGNRYASNAAGAGGNGGGGAGGKGGIVGSGTIAPTSGAANTGGGGGGAGGGLESVAYSGGGGGSGVVIVRYVLNPDAPTITASTSGSTQATVDYTLAAVTGGSSITDVEYSVNNGSTWTSFGEADGSSVITGLTNGTTYSILIRAVNADGYKSASSPSPGPSVTPRGAQTLTWSPTNSTVDLTAGEVTLTPAASALGGVTIHYSVQTVGAAGCAVPTSSSPRVTYSAIGTCVIRATALQGGAYLSATTDVTLTVTTLTAQSIAFADLIDKTYGDATFTVTPSASSSLPVTVTSTTSSVCTVSSGTVTIVGVGTCSLTASQAGDSTYAVAPNVTKTMTVAPKPITVSVSFANKPYDGNLNATISGTPTLVGVVAGDANYVSVVVAKITGSFASAGADTNKPITVTFASGALAAGSSGDRSARYTISGYGSPTANIDKINQTVTFSSSTPGSLVSGDTYTPTAATTSGLAIAISVASSSSGVCSISSGVVTMNAAGSCALEAAQSGDSNYNAATTATMTFAVQLRSQSIGFSNLVSKTYGDGTFTVSPSATSGLSVTVVSLTTSVCSISSNTVTILDVGTCSLQASQAGNGSYSAAADVTKSMTVSAKPVTVSLAFSDKQYNGSSRATLSGTPTLSGVLPADTNYVSLDSTKMTGLFGTPSVGANKPITVTFATGALTAGTAGDRSARYYISGYGGPTAEITQATQAPLSFTSPSYMIYGQTIPLVAVGGSSTGALSYSKISGPCVLSNNQATSTGAGSCVVTVTRAGDANYSALTSSTFTVTIGKANQSLIFTSVVPSVVTSGMTFTPTATSSANLPVSYSIANTSSSVCSINIGVVSLDSSGTCIIEAIQSGDSNFNAANTITQSLSVGLINQSIQFPAIGNKSFADPAFAAGATVSSGRSASYTSATPSICTVDSSTGLISLILVGDCKVIASSAGDSSYAAASSVSRTFTVSPIVAGKPTITSVSYGDSEVTLGIAPPSFTGGESVDGYQVIATTGGSSITAPFCVIGSPCTVTGLTNGLPYTFVAAAINGAGVGPNSDSSPSIIPVATPEAVTALVTTPGDQQLSITWSPLTSSQLGGATFLRYDVSIRQRGASWSSAVTPSAQNHLDTRTTDSFTFTGLVNGQAYDVQIVAITSANGSAIQSNTTTALGVPATVPSAPLNLVLTVISDSEVIASWTPPTNDGGAAIAEYEVNSTVSLSSVITSPTAFFVGLTSPACTFAQASDTFCMMSGLSAGQNVAVSVGAINLLGTGSVASANVRLPGGTAPVVNVITDETISSQPITVKRANWIIPQNTVSPEIGVETPNKVITPKKSTPVDESAASSEDLLPVQGNSGDLWILLISLGAVFVAVLWFVIGFARKKRAAHS